MPLQQRDYHARLGAVRTAVAGQLIGLWDSLGSWRDRDVDKFVRIAVPKVQAGQIATARLTSQYLGGGVNREAVLTARKVDPREEFRRPAVALYTALSKDSALDVAVRAGSVLLNDLILTDLQLANVVQSQTSLRDGGHARYRRVLTGAENCPLCEIASQNVYSTRDLLPIHDKCDCTVEPIVSRRSTALDISSLALTGSRRTEVESGASPESLIAVREHGETGPTLTWASDHFTGPEDI